MKIVILTTKTNHHYYFLKKISEKFPKKLEVFFENRKITFPYKTSHNFEKKRDNFEKQYFFGNKSLNKVSGKNYANINSQKCIDRIKSINPKVIVVFGTGKINNNLIKNFKNKIFNLHGGDPQLYRGLDSHLWGIYHNDYNFSVTLHKLTSKLDAGDIVYKKNIKKKNIKIWEIRYFTTLICIKLTIKLLDKFKNNSKIVLKKQKKIGRYYSAMPASLKEVCSNKMK